MPKAYYWVEEHHVGEPHYHFYPYNRTKYPTRKLYEDMINILNELKEKYNLEWRDYGNLWDEEKRRMYVQTVMIPTKSFPSENRIHVTVFNRGKPLFRELIERLDVEKVQGEP